MPQAPKTLFLIHIVGWKNSPLSLLAHWGNKNGLPSMNVKKLEKFHNKISLKGCKWSSTPVWLLQGPGTFKTPLSDKFLKVGNMSINDV